MVWGSIAASGRCGLWFSALGKTINASVYLSILKEKLQTFMTIRNCSVFQHDGVPCHTACLMKEWLAEQHIEVLGRGQGLHLTSTQLNFAGWWL